jgi:hypothetical protein
LRQLLIGILFSIITTNIASCSTVTFANVVNATYNGGNGIPAGDFEGIVTTNDNGTITVELENLLSNPNDDTGEISAIQFVVMGLGAVSLSATTKPTGQLININTSTNAWTNDTVDSITHWTANGVAGGSSTTVTLTTIGGGTPKDLIIGPPNSSNQYTGNNSIATHLPSIQDIGTFTINMANVTSATKIQITGVTFNVGTTTNSLAALVAVPEPGLFLPILLALPAGLYLRRKRV